MGLLIRAGQKGLLSNSIIAKRDNTNVASKYKFHPETEKEALSRKRKDNIKEDKFQKEVDKKWKLVQDGSFFTVNYKDRKQLESVMRKQLGMRKEWDNKSAIDKTEAVTGEVLLAFAPELIFGRVGRIKSVPNIIKSEKNINFVGGKKMSQMNDEYNNLIKTHESIIRDATDSSEKIYMFNVSHDRNLQKFLALDKLEGGEGLNLKSVQKWLQEHKQGNIKIYDGLSERGVSNYTKNVHEKNMKRYFMMKSKETGKSLKEVEAESFADDHKGYLDYINKTQHAKLKDDLPPFQRDIGINALTNKVKDVYTTISHELSHDINSGGAYIGKVYKGMVKKAFKLNDNFSQYLSGYPTKEKELEYLSDPSEVFSFIGTNLKDELVRGKYIKTIHDDIPLDVLKKAIKAEDVNTLNRYNGVIKDIDLFHKLVNITPYGVVGGVGINKVANMKNNKGLNKNIKGLQIGGITEYKENEFISNFKLDNLAIDKTRLDVNENYEKVYPNLPDTNPVTGEKIDTNAYYGGIMGVNKPVVKPKSFSDIYIGRLAKKRGMKAEDLTGYLNDFSKWLSTVESDNNNKATPDSTTAKGYFQFTDESEKTLKQRVKNVSRRIKAKAPQYMRDYVSGKKKLTDLNYNQQRALLIINFAETKESNIESLKNKANYVKQYPYHHRDESVLEYLAKTGELDWSKAADKNVALNLLRVKNLDYNKEFIK